VAGSDGAVMAVDVGGTTIKAAIVDGAGRVRREVRRPTPAARGPEAVIAELQAVVSELSEPAAGDGREVRAVAVVVPGIVDAAAGRAEFSANLGFRGVPLRDLIESAAGLPTVLDHDVRAAGVAELTVGIGHDVGDHLLAVIGTGISGVIHAAGRPVRGAGGIAGELGHVPVAPGGRPCPCGQRGCLERYAAAPAIARRYAELGGEAGVSAREVAARRGRDPAADRAWREAVEALAIAFATCTMLLDPAMIILAGGLSGAGDGLLEPVTAELAARVTWRDPPPVRLSPLGARAGLVGAAVLAWRLAGVDPAALAWQLAGVDPAGDSSATG
jgi:glucokinase